MSPPNSSPLSPSSSILQTSMQCYTMFFSSSAHFLKICSERPACSIPGVANTTIGPGLSMYERSKGCMRREHSNLLSIQKLTLKWLFFLQILTFDISADWPKNAKFCTHKYQLHVYRTLEQSHVCVQITNISTRKVCFKPKSEKNVPAYNCHPKVARIGCNFIYKPVFHTEGGVP